MAASDLLVSVRSALEAEAALQGGADIIDVKEPMNGPLGRSDISTISAVTGFVQGRVPVSAALGELAESADLRPLSNLHFVKWGLAQSGSRWRERLLEVGGRWTGINQKLHLVAVAYADWRQAQSPAPNDVLAFVRDNRWAVLLVDTFTKGEKTLLDWMSQEEIKRMCGQCRDHRIKIALAGSLGREEISILLPLRPDIFAVRGAVCRGKDRAGNLDPTLVRELSTLIRGSANRG